MADNLTTQTTVSTVSSGTVIATEDIGGAHYQKVAIVLTDGTTINALLDAGQQLSAASLPVVLSSDHSDIKVTLDSEAVTISGTVQVQSNSANLATETTAAAIQTAVEIIDNAISGSEMQTDIVTIAAGASADIGATTDLEATGNGSIIAILKRLRTLLGGTLTVSGTVTANLSATDNAVLDNIDSNTDYGQVTGGGLEATALRVTIANDSTGVVSVDDNGGSLTVDGTVSISGTVTVDGSGVTQPVSAASLPLPTGAATAANQLPDGHNVTVDNAAGSPIPVEITDGTNPATIRNLASNDALNVAIVDGAGNQVTSFGGSGGTSATDDSAFTAGTGSGTPMMAFATSDSVDSGDVGVVGMDTARNLKVSIEADNVGIGGGTQYTEDDAAVANPVGNMGMAVRADSLAAVTSLDGDNIALRATNNGELYVKQTDAVPVTDNGGSLTVDGTVTETNSAAILADTANMDTNIGTIAGAVSGFEMQVDVVTSALPSGAATAANQGTANTALSAIQTAVETLDNIVSGSEAQVDIVAPLPAGTNNIGDVDVLTVPAPLNVTGGGTEAAALRVTLANDSTGVVSVDDGGGSLTVDGTVAVSGTVTVDLGANNDVVAAGNVAHDAADSGNPVKVGFKAKAFDGTAPGTDVAEDDRVDAIATVEGRQYVETTHPNHWTATGNYSTAQTDTSVKAAPGAGLSLYVTDVVLTTDTAMNIELEASTTDIVPPMYFAANGGAALHFQTPIKLAANTALTITSSATGNHSVLVNGFTAA